MPHASLHGMSESLLRSNARQSEMLDPREDILRKKERTKRTQRMIETCKESFTNEQNAEYFLSKDTDHSVDGIDLPRSGLMIDYGNTFLGSLNRYMLEKTLDNHEYNCGHEEEQDPEMDNNHNQGTKISADKSTVLPGKQDTEKAPRRSSRNSKVKAIRNSTSSFTSPSDTMGAEFSSIQAPLSVNIELTVGEEELAKAREFLRNTTGVEKGRIECL